MVVLYNMSVAGVRVVEFGGPNAVVAKNEVALRRARLLLGWVTVCGQVNHLGM